MCSADCCDLLSISYLWHTVHNAIPYGTYQVIVVICFQYLIFDILYTTCVSNLSISNTLWFAFNILSLTYCTQPQQTSESHPHRCDLLSISYLWHTVHNLKIIGNLASPVVICFQYLIFDILYTTRLSGVWIIFCCDLLSISYLWHTVHNFIPLKVI